MAYDESRPGGDSAHHIILEERTSLTVSGVEDVESFDEESILLETARGALVIRGSGLHIERLSLDGGDLKVEGTIDSLTYEESRLAQGSFFARLFR